MTHQGQQRAAVLTKASYKAIAEFQEAKKPKRKPKDVMIKPNLPGKTNAKRGNPQSVYLLSLQPLGGDLCDLDNDDITLFGAMIARTCHKASLAHQKQIIISVTDTSEPDDSGSSFQTFVSRVNSVIKKEGKTKFSSLYCYGVKFTLA